MPRKKGAGGKPNMDNRFKLARTQHNQHGPQSVKEVASVTGITKSLIDDLESTLSNKRNVGYLTVKKMAEYYGVSSDYLLGLSPTPSTDKDIQAVCKFTGLSTKAVTALNKADSDEHDLISFLIENRISSDISNKAHGCALDKVFILTLKKSYPAFDLGKDEMRKIISESDDARKSYNEVIRLQDRVDTRLWRCHKILESAIESFISHMLEEWEKNGKH